MTEIGVNSTMVTSRIPGAEGIGSVFVIFIPFSDELIIAKPSMALCLFETDEYTMAEINNHLLSTLIKTFNYFICKTLT